MSLHTDSPVRQTSSPGTEPGASHSHDHSHAATGNIALAFFLNFGFSIFEAIGGFFTGSIAIISDALHDFGDSLSLAVAWRLQKVSERKADSKYSYGYKRFSLLGALFISVVLLAGSVFILTKCFSVIGDYVQGTPPTHEPNAQGMLWLAVIGVAVNLVAALRLGKGRSLSERAVMLHMLEDVFGWLAVLVVSTVMLFVELPILDPILSVAISLWVLWNVFRNLRDTLKVLMQHVPEGVDAAALRAELLALPDVVSLHDEHIWSLDGENNVMSLHVVVPLTVSRDRLAELKSEIRMVCASHGVGHTTIELEGEGHDCPMTDCC